MSMKAIKRKFMGAIEEQPQNAVPASNSVGVQIKDIEKVRTNNNQIWLYDEISDQSLYTLKTSIYSINQLYDLTKLQYGGMLKFQPVIHLHIASNGGCCFSGLHMYDIVKHNKYPIYTYVDGFIASAASLPFLAGTKRYMSPNAFMMIHQLSTWFIGTFQNLKDQYESSAKVMNKFKQVYRAELNMDADKLQELLKRDIWLDKQQANALGFIRE